MVRGFLVTVFVVALALVPIGAASAETSVVDGGKIAVHARILATHYIIIDEHDTIIQIDSNTQDIATPRVFEHKVTSGNEREMTQAIYRQYERLIPGGKSHVGTVYRTHSSPVLAALNPQYHPQLPVLPLSK